MIGFSPFDGPFGLGGEASSDRTSVVFARVRVQRTGWINPSFSGGRAVVEIRPHPLEGRKELPLLEGQFEKDECGREERNPAPTTRRWFSLRVGFLT